MKTFSPSPFKAAVKTPDEEKHLSEKGLMRIREMRSARISKETLYQIDKYVRQKLKDEEIFQKEESADIKEESSNKPSDSESVPRVVPAPSLPSDSNKFVTPAQRVSSVPRFLSRSFDDPDSTSSNRKMIEFEDW